MAKENNGKLFGFNLPWNEDHHEHEHIHFETTGDHGDMMPIINTDEEHGEDEENEEHEEDE